MFSVDDPMIRHQWTVSLRRQIDTAASSMTASISTLSVGAPKFHFKVLQETLLGPDASSAPPPAALEQGAPPPDVDSPNESPSRFSSERCRSVASVRKGNGQLNGSAHTRSKSRSQMYHQHGDGQDGAGAQLQRVREARLGHRRRRPGKSFAFDHEQPSRTVRTVRQIGGLGSGKRSGPCPSPKL